MHEQLFDIFMVDVTMTLAYITEHGDLSKTQALDCLCFFPKIDQRHDDWSSHSS